MPLRLVDVVEEIGLRWSMRIITLSQGRPEKALHERCPTHFLVPATWLTSGKPPGRICRGGSFAPATLP
ncbi:hypothetical protein BOSE62_30044 [Bosea sp. 62]|nr:hypothetical protein BOSE46_140191 [Bosea sp. 46]CAD5268998.1 hypothetical protein BOSE7B_20046 [Bosea sp. 7B]CAD5269617.1 hypothetical protein BOSE21B_111592 [Bosea sp. 21B]VVT62541.1 hypothetical protein BOS5A_80201 [Bosea sp. EC-HK365B]VXB96957.1 hypothetical protein BOSE29B_150185 [Bosea sp. 29B]VXC07501.1 hypothetical protein BOSE62_30044 [Bosea sp. 62]VXC42285.1 hypothetical protein BOSE125_200158 [Bosea sp. 125]VXC62030.1 hypothetical protein BOSE127_30060 [Bosea sp. 127]